MKRLPLTALSTALASAFVAFLPVPASAALPESAFGKDPANDVQGTAGYPGSGSIDIRRYTGTRIRKNIVVTIRAKNVRGPDNDDQGWCAVIAPKNAILYTWCADNTGTVQMGAWADDRIACSDEDVAVAIKPAVDKVVFRVPVACFAERNRPWAVSAHSQWAFSVSGPRDGATVGREFTEWFANTPGR